MNKTLPWWLTLIVFIETLPMFLGPYYAVFHPASMPWLGPAEVSGASFFYTGRNLAVGLALIFVYFLKSRSMLFILIFVRLITDFVDLPTLFYFHDVSRPSFLISVFVFLYYIPAFIALRYLWNHME